MILSFAVKNYKSIKDLLILDFTTEKSEVQPKFEALVKKEQGQLVTRLNFLYGKNGSGKSSIVDALKALCKLGISDNNKTSESEKLIIKPFKFLEVLESKTFFTLLFVNNQKKYRYSVSYDVNKEIIDDEQLKYIEDDKEIIIFSKLEDQFLNLNQSELERLKTYKLEKNSILRTLSKEIEISNINIKAHIDNVFSFINKIYFNFTKLNSTQSIKQLINNPKKLNEIKSKIKKFDLTISDIKVEEKDINREEFNSKYSSFFDESDEQINKSLRKVIDTFYELQKYNLEIMHDQNGLNYQEESKGTQRALDILFSVYNIDSGVFIIDDFENDLHSKSAQELVKYLAKEFITHQFLFVTHDLEMLDLKEVKFKPLHFFAERDTKDFSTTIERLTTFKDLRSDSRNSWKNFYENHRLTQFPNISINDKDGF
ncbi:putative abortive phage resistance protein [Alteracholeplasma palmae J233]|uniref:Putative abortive phage resistance protein n=1 Tax=Alteracholeplasma palmae (strain ATCC 49389 / J233) TaxID=1318466 RepID=U4KKQ8_ALTPJ|nr:ATP-binding protein [Alteracholeplasma palmae]CCV64252.1 putative abortive phage resistance protein [Alteracholeplasma palmae J233]